MIARVVLAVVVGVVVALVTILVGGLLTDLRVDFAVTVGDWLQKYGAVLGLLAGLWYFFSGGFSISWPHPPAA